MSRLPFYGFGWFYRGQQAFLALIVAEVDGYHSTVSDGFTALHKVRKEPGQSPILLSLTFHAVALSLSRRRKYTNSYTRVRPRSDTKGEGDAQAQRLVRQDDQGGRTLRRRSRRLRPRPSRAPESWRRRTQVLDPTGPRRRPAGHQPRATNLGLGQYPLVELAEARAKALENARAVAAGRDPRTSAAPTFEEAAQEVIRLRIPTWRSGSKSAEQWRASFRDYVYPVIGPKPVSEITPADVLAVLSPHWHDRAETMRRVKQRLGAVLDWAVAHGHASDNPARGAVVAAALPRQPGGRHQRALQPGDVAAALTTVDASGAHLSTRLTLRFIVLTACRSGEALNARWDEINTETATVDDSADPDEDRPPVPGAAVVVGSRRARGSPQVVGHFRAGLPERDRTATQRQHGVEAAA